METAQYDSHKTSRKSFSGTLGAAVQVLGNKKDRTFVEIEYLSEDKWHKPGETEKIVVDYVEIGRAPDNVIRFSDIYPTVHRKHAVIYKDTVLGKWKLKYYKDPKNPNKKMNPIYVNGQYLKPEIEWVLADKDIIQFSTNGPQIRFREPDFRKSSVRTLSTTQRIGLALEQGLKPFRKQIRTLAAIIVLLLVIGGSVIYLQQSKINIIETENQGLQSTLAAQNRMIDSLKNVLDTSRQAQEAVKQRLRRLQRQFESVRRQQTNNQGLNNTSQRPSANINSIISQKINSVYFIQAVEISYSFAGQTASSNNVLWSGTGFLLDDGRFVTAEHVVKPWLFLNKSDYGTPEYAAMITLNIVENNGGHVIVRFKAYSPSNTLEFTSDDFVVDNSDTRDTIVPGDNGNQYVIKIKPMPTKNDWAYAIVSQRGSLKAYPGYNPGYGDQLHILGYPFGLGAVDQSNINPTYSTVSVSQNQYRLGLLYISGRSFDHGNSGGPVMILKNNDLVVVGIVSSGVAQQGFIVPIKYIYQNN